MIIMSGNEEKFSVLDISDDSESPSQIFRSAFMERAWLKNHGKQDFIPFSEQSLRELRKYFNSLDQKKTGSIGVEQLQVPFIALGLSQCREDVMDLIIQVDLDGSGTIEFDQFLQIMLKIKRGKSGGSKNSAIFDFFHRMSTGQLGEQYDKDLSFKLNVSQYRRKRLLESIMSDEKNKKQKGAKILQNFRKQIVSNPELNEALNRSKKSTAMMQGISIKKRNNE